jgi:hypothetical protein
VVSWDCWQVIYRNRPPLVARSYGYITGLGLISSDVPEDIAASKDETWNVGNVPEHIGAAIDNCTGIVLNLFVSSPQVDICTMLLLTYDDAQIGLAGWFSRERLPTSK